MVFFRFVTEPFSYFTSTKEVDLVWFVWIFQKYLYVTKNAYSCGWVILPEFGLWPTWTLLTFRVITKDS